MRRIGVLMALAADDPETAARNAALLQTLQQFGWADGRNVRIEYRWSLGDAERMRRYAAELAALGPDIILAVGGATTAATLQATRTIPIVFVQATDPVGAGLVANLARPGGTVTGFTLYEYGISAKWLEILKQIVPSLKRAAVLRDPDVPASTAQFAAIQAVAPLFGVEVSTLDVRDPSEIERAIAMFAQSPNGSLIAVSSATSVVHRNAIVTLAARYRLSAIYHQRAFVTGGGLVSYGPDVIDQYRLAASYIDRILRGEKPADLPVQAPTKYELVLNLKTAKALGLTIPETLLATADEVIQ